MAANWSHLAKQAHNHHSALAMAILYKLPLVGITYELTNEQPQESHLSSHRALGMPARKW